MQSSIIASFWLRSFSYLCIMLQIRSWSMVMYSSVILLFFVVDSVDTALELVVCTQGTECINDA